MMDDKRLEELSAQHHMEGGGYRFDNAEGFEGFEDRHGVVLWEDPDYDYLGVERPPREAWNTTFFLEPHGYPETEWTKRITRKADDGDVYVWERVSSGWFYQGETECGCNGSWPTNEPMSNETAVIVPTGELLEELAGQRVEVHEVKHGVARVFLPSHPGTQNFEVPVAELKLPWEFSGNVGGDDAYPFCPHCEGDGYRHVEPGAWAVYESVELEDEDEDEEDEDES